jgi:hypothetical protein
LPNFRDILNIMGSKQKIGIGVSVVNMNILTNEARGGALIYHMGQ